MVDSRGMIGGDNGGRRKETEVPRLNFCCNGTRQRLEGLTCRSEAKLNRALIQIEVEIWSPSTANAVSNFSINFRINEYLFTLAAYCDYHPSCLLLINSPYLFFITHYPLKTRISLYITMEEEVAALVRVIINLLQSSFLTCYFR